MNEPPSLCALGIPQSRNWDRYLVKLNGTDCTYYDFILTKQGCEWVFIFRGLCGLSDQAVVGRGEGRQQNEWNDKIMVATHEVNCNGV